MHAHTFICYAYIDRHECTQTLHCTHTHTYTYHTFGAIRLTGTWKVSHWKVLAFKVSHWKVLAIII